MTDSKILNWIKDDRDPYFENLVLQFQNVTPALVNGIRRTMLSEVNCFSLGLKNNKMLTNSSFLNSDYIRHRVALLPIFQKDKESDFNIEDGRLVFRLCDPEDFSKSFKNLRADAHKVYTWTDLITLRLRKEYSNLRFTMDQLGHYDWVPEAEEETEDIAGDTPEKDRETIEQTGSGKSWAEREEEEPIDEESVGDDEFLERDDEFNEVPPEEPEEGVEEDAEEIDEELGEEQEEEEEYQEFGPVLKTHEDWNKYYEQVPTRDYIKYNFYLTKLRFKEEILLQIIPDYLNGLDHTTFESCTQAGYWFGEKRTPIQPGTYKKSKEYPQYPEQINLEIEFNGHYPNPVVFNLALKTLQEKIATFRTELQYLVDIKATGTNDLDEDYFQVTDLTEKFSLENQTPDTFDWDNFLVLGVKDESHTLGQLIATYGTLFFQNIVKNKTNDEKIKLMKNFFCSYRLPHPLEREIWIQVKTPDEKLWEGSFSDQYGTLNRPYQILFVTLDIIDNLLTELETETDGMWPQIPEFDGRKILIEEQNSSEETIEDEVEVSDLQS